MDLHCITAICHVAVIDSVFHVPNYSNHLVINMNVAYIPYGWTHSIPVIIKRIQGQGPFHDVTLEWSIPSGKHSEAEVQ